MTYTIYLVVAICLFVLGMVAWAFGLSTLKEIQSEDIEGAIAASFVLFCLSAIWLPVVCLFVLCGISAGAIILLSRAIHPHLTTEEVDEDNE